MTENTPKPNENDMPAGFSIWIDEAGEVTEEAWAAMKARVQAAGSTPAMTREGQRHEAEALGRALGTLFLPEWLFEALGRPENCAPNPRLPVLPEPKRVADVFFAPRRERGHPLNPGRHKAKRKRKL